MGFRQSAKDRPTLFAVVFGALILVCIAVVIWQLTGSTDPRLGSGKAFFSVDDGKTFFVADSSKVAPFDHNGQQAYQAMVYSADGGKTRSVGYLMRFSEKGKAKMNEMRAKIKETRGMPSMDAELQANTEVKRPGEKNWVKLSDVGSAAEIMRVASPDDPSRSADPIEP